MATEAELRKSTPRGKQLEDMAWKALGTALANETKAFQRRVEEQLLRDLLDAFYACTHMCVDDVEDAVNLIHEFAKDRQLGAL